MRISLILLISSVMYVFSSEGYSQTTSLTFTLENVSVEDVLDEIEEYSEFRFLYNKRLVDVSRKVSISVENREIEDILQYLFENEPVKYTISDHQIVLSFREKPTEIQQQKEVSGLVTDMSGTPIAGVTVVAVGTEKGTITNMDGEYALSIDPATTTLRFSFLGMQTVNLTISGKSVLNVTMKEDAVHLEEVVAIGYGTQKKASLTGSVSVVRVDEVMSSSISSGNIMRAIEGRVPGIETSYSGYPDGGATILIRGKGTLNDTAPLYIIDGVPTSRGLNEIASSDIESVQILKDASAASIYGARAANGVIIVTTRKAKKGTKIQFSSSLSARVLRKNPLPLLNTQEYGRAQWMAARNDGLDPNYGVYSYKDHQDASGKWILDEVLIPEWLDEERTMRSSDTDWQKEISRTGFIQNYNIAFSKGTENGHALFSADYLKNQGTTKANDWERITVRVNTDYSMFNNRLKVGEDLSILKMRGTGGNHLGSTANIQPIVPVRTVDGEGWGGPVKGMSDRLNPVLAIELGKPNHADHLRMLGSVYGDLELFKNLHFKSTFGLDYVAHWQRTMEYTYQSGYMSRNEAKLNQNSGYTGSWTWNNVFNYDFTFEKNTFSLTAGQEAVYFINDNMSASRDGFTLENPDYMYLGVGETNMRNGGGASDAALNSYFGRINYIYNDRYLASVIVRRDGSSRFGKNNRYGTFPAFSLGWVLSEENFMRSVSFLNSLKLRYGWGQTGNQEIDYYASYGTYQAYYGGGEFPPGATAYDIYGRDTGTLPSGYNRVRPANNNLRWEATTQNNAGVDFGLFSSKLNGSFDFYVKNTKDILVRPPVIGVSGLGSERWFNGASMKNWGWEFIASYADKVGDVRYVITANASGNKNRITSLPQQAMHAYPGNGTDDTIINRPINSFYGYICDGIFQNQEEVDSAPNQPGKGVGRLRYRDVNGDGKVDLDDRTWIGVSNPKLMVGLSIQLEWKEFDFSMFWRGSFGQMVNNSTKSFTDFFGFFGGQNYGKKALDCWSPDNPKSTIPALTTVNSNDETRFSTYFIENASYIKLATMEIGYRLPQDIGKKIYLQNARFYLEGQNLLTIGGFGKKPFSGFDPQYPGTGYPVPINLTFGLNLTF